MSTYIKLKRGSTAKVTTYTPQLGEPVWDNDRKELYVGDGVQQGGYRVGSYAALNATLIVDVPNEYGDVLFTAVEAGTAGNDITIEYVDPELTSQPLSISVTDKDITVNLQTNIDGDIITTANDIVSAITADSTASILVTAELNEEYGTGIVSAYSKTNLSGGQQGGQSFIDLNDVPINYDAAGGKVVKVNLAETRLEFVDPSLDIIDNQLIYG